MTHLAVKIHQRTHSSVRPYTCEICGFSFKQHGDMLRHYKKHEKQGQTTTVARSTTTAGTSSLNSSAGTSQCNSTFGDVSSLVSNVSLASSGVTLTSNTNMSITSSLASDVHHTPDITAGVKASSIMPEEMKWAHSVGVEQGRSHADLRDLGTRIHNTVTADLTRVHHALQDFNQGPQNLQHRQDGLANMSVPPASVHHLAVGTNPSQRHNSASVLPDMSIPASLHHFLHPSYH